MIASAAALSLTFTQAKAEAGVPASITHQGRLFSASGAPVSEKLTVTFAVYEAGSGGAALWEEAHEVAFDSGYFSVSLGEKVPLDTSIFDGSVRYLGVKVGADPEMTPRAAVRSVPYALLVNDVNGDINPHSISIQAGAIYVDGSSGGYAFIGNPGVVQTVPVACALR
jgi:hypothetical protein